MVALKSALSTRTAARSVSVRTLTPSNALRPRVLAPRALPVELTDAVVNSVAVAVNPIANLADGTVDVVTNTSAAGAGAFSIAGLFSGLLGNRKVAGLSAAEAYQYLIKEPRTILLDIRNKPEAATGTPDLKDAKKRVLSLPYTKVVGDEEVLVEDFLEKFQRLKAIKDDSFVVLLDFDGSLANKAATALANAQVPQERILFIRGGFEGSQGWLAANLPWKEPLSLPTLSIPNVDLPDSLDNFADSFKKNPSMAQAALALGAIVGSAVFIINEFDTLLELAGVLGVGNLVYKNLLYADDREKALGKLRAFVQQTGADGAGDELLKVAKAVLEKADAAVTAAAESRAAEAAAAAEAALAAETAAATAATAAAAAEAAATPPVTVAAAAPAEAAAPASAATEADTSASNVEEARAWISAWKGKQETKAEVAAAAVAVVPENVAEARAWIANWKAQNSKKAAAAAVAAAAAQAQQAVKGDPVPAEKEVLSTLA